MMLVQILLPLSDKAGEAFPPEHYRTVGDELTARFGGVTAYTRAPAQGRWKEARAAVVHDEIVVFEVMIERLDADWWHRYRRQLQERFGQDVIVIRAHAIEML